MSNPFSLTLLVPLSLLAACGGPEDTGTTGTTGTSTTTTAAWSFVSEGLGGALLSITGTSATDVWTVGADDGSGPLALHWDGAGWTRVATGTTGDLWWTWVAGPDLVYMVGAGGRVLTYVPSTDTTTETVLDAALTFFGVWGSSPDDVYLVGGDVNVAADAGVIYHWDGATWSQMAIPAEASSKNNVFKVWGRSASEVYFVGPGGLVVTYDGADFTVWPLNGGGFARTLFTVNGNASEVFAVGGFSDGNVFRFDGAAWTEETPMFAPQFNGVFAQEGCDPVAAGSRGGVFRRTGGVWAEDAKGAASVYDFHATYVDPDCGLWAVGGSISSTPLDEGMLLYDGPQAVAAYP